jgi:hypothetical protein
MDVPESFAGNRAYVSPPLMYSIYGKRHYSFMGKMEHFAIVKPHATESTKKETESAALLLGDFN